MIKFRLRYGNGAKAPFVGVRVEKDKTKDGRAYRVSVHESVLQNVVSYIVKGLLIRPRNFVVTLVAPPLKGEAKAALRAALPKFATRLRSEIERRVRQALEEVRGHEAPIFKGQRTFVPGWALTARVLLLPQKAQEEFDRWFANQRSEYVEKLEKELEEKLEEEESHLFLEGPHFGDIEERAEDILLRLLPQDRFELVPEEGGLGASLARARWIKREGIIAPLVRDRAEALRVIEDYEALRARELAKDFSSTSPLDSVDLLRSLYDGEYLVEVAVALLHMLGLEWPVRLLGGKLPEVKGVHPLFEILEAARLEAAWGRLMDRLGSEDFDLLRAARRFQRLLGEGLSLEEALEETGLPLEAALLLTEGPRLAEYLGEEEEPLLELDEDTVLETFRQEALEEAMAAWGFRTSEEALEALEALGEDPLAQAFRADVQRRFEAKRLAVGM